MAQVTNLQRCSDGALLTYGGTIVFPPSASVVKIAGQCYTLVGYDVGNATPSEEPSGFYYDCDACALSAVESVYVLLPCISGDPIYTLTPGIATYFGSVIKLDGKCYTVVITTPSKVPPGGLEDINLVSPSIYGNCSLCLNKYLKITRCDTSDFYWLDASFYSVGSGKTVKMSDGNCYTTEAVLTGQTYSTNDTLTISRYYGTCDDCLVKDFLRLGNCSDPQDVIYVHVATPSLQAAIGKTVLINVEGTNKCYAVTLVSMPKNTVQSSLPGAIVNIFEGCFDCFGALSPIIDPDLHGETQFDIAHVNANCDKLRFTNLTILHDPTLYTGFANATLQVVFPGGIRLILSEATVPVTSPLLEVPFDNAFPSGPMVVSLADLENLLEFGVLSVSDGQGGYANLEAMPWETFPDGIYEVTWTFHTAGETTGEYSFTKNMAFTCNMDLCFVLKAQESISTGCDSCDHVTSIEVCELLALINSFKANVELGRYDCANTIAEAIFQICDLGNCGCATSTYGEALYHSWKIAQSNPAINNIILPLLETPLDYIDPDVGVIHDATTNPNTSTP